MALPVHSLSIDNVNNSTVHIEYFKEIIKSYSNMNNQLTNIVKLQSSTNDIITEINSKISDLYKKVNDIYEIFILDKGHKGRT